MRPHGASVVATIVERNAVLFRHQGVNCKRITPGSREPGSPVSLHFRSADEVAALATFDGSSVIVEVEQRFQAALFAGVYPINNDTDGIEFQGSRSTMLELLWTKKRKAPEGHSSPSQLNSRILRR